MLDFAITVLVLCILAVVVSGTAIFVQIAIERFVTVTVPILADFYFRIRYPDEYNKE